MMIKQMKGRERYHSHASVSLVPSSGTPATRNLTNSSKTKSSTPSPSLQGGVVCGCGQWIYITTTGSTMEYRLIHYYHSFDHTNYIGAPLKDTPEMRTPPSGKFHSTAYLTFAKLSAN